MAIVKGPRLITLSPSVGDSEKELRTSRLGRENINLNHSGLTLVLVDPLNGDGRLTESECTLN